MNFSIAIDDYEIETILLTDETSIDIKVVNFNYYVNINAQYN